MFINISRFWSVLVVVSALVCISINIEIFDIKKEIWFFRERLQCCGSSAGGLAMDRSRPAQECGGMATIFCIETHPLLTNFLMNKSIFVGVVSRLWMEFCLLDSWGSPDVCGTTWFADTDADSWCRIELCFHWKYVYLSCINVRVVDTCIVPDL